jgi:hypothetical protein
MPHVRSARPSRRRGAQAVIALALALAATGLIAAPAAAATSSGDIACASHQTAVAYAYDARTFVYSPGDFCLSDGTFKLVFQGDGNFVLYDGAKAKWATYTATTKGTLRLQTDGNIVIYDGNSKVLWASKTGGNHYDHYSLTNDGLLYGASASNVVKPIWTAFYAIG